MSAAYVKPKGKESSFWRVSTPNKRVTESGWGLDLGAPLSVATMAGDDVENGEIKPNQKVVLNFGTLSDTKYQTHVRVNADLGNYATIISYPNFLEPGEMTDIQVILRADKALDLKTFDWLVRIYAVD